jgi:hypothetical protein
MFVTPTGSAKSPERPRAGSCRFVRPPTRSSSAIRAAGASPSGCSFGVFGSRASTPKLLKKGVRSYVINGEGVESAHVPQDAQFHSRVGSAGHPRGRHIRLRVDQFVEQDGQPAVDDPRFRR